MRTNDRVDQRTAIAGMLLGTAVGDAIGLPWEGLRSDRIARRLGTKPLTHRLVLGRGMFSDDTEHACMTAQAWLASHGEPSRFARSLAWRLRGWLLGVPAGTGLATLRSILRLWVGVPPHRSGVWSAGNGPGMRAGILGLLASHDAQLLELIRVSTLLTHRDPRALEGATVVARCAKISAKAGSCPLDPSDVIAQVAADLTGQELLDHLAVTVDAVKRCASAVDFAASRGWSDGITGYINHTVPAAIFCWLRYQDDYRAGVDAAVRLGGDTDTVAAIVGGLIGAGVGPAGIPPAWQSAIVDWPRSIAWISRLAERLADVQAGKAAKPLPLLCPLLPLRNAVFAGIVLAHGFRRLAPPY